MTNASASPSVGKKIQGTTLGVVLDSDMVFEALSKALEDTLLGDAADVVGGLGMTIRDVKEQLGVRLPMMQAAAKDYGEKVGHAWNEPPTMSDPSRRYEPTSIPPQENENAELGQPGEAADVASNERREKEKKAGEQIANEDALFAQNTPPDDPVWEGLDYDAAKNRAAESTRQTAPNDTTATGDTQGAPDNQRNRSPGNIAPEGTPQDNEPTDRSAGTRAETRERSGFTQRINTIRYRRDLDNLSKRLKDLTKRKTVLQRGLRRTTRQLFPLQSRKRSRQSLIRILKIVRLVCWTIGFLLSLFGIGLFFAPAALYLGRVIHRMRTIVKQLEEKMKPMIQRVKHIEENIKKIDKEAQEIGKRIRELRNRSLFERQGPAPAPVPT